MEVTEHHDCLDISPFIHNCEECPVNCGQCLQRQRAWFQIALFCFKVGLIRLWFLTKPLCLSTNQQMNHLIKHIDWFCQAMSCREAEPFISRARLNCELFQGDLVVSSWDNTLEQEWVCSFYIPGEKYPHSETAPQIITAQHMITAQHLPSPMVKRKCIILCSTRSEWPLTQFHSLHAIPNQRDLWDWGSCACSAPLFWFLLQCLLHPKVSGTLHGTQRMNKQNTRPSGRNTALISACRESHSLWLVNPIFPTWSFRNHLPLPGLLLRRSVGCLCLEFRLQFHWTKRDLSFCISTLEQWDLWHSHNTK